MRVSRQEWMKRQVFKIFFLSILAVLFLVGIYTFFFVSVGESGRRPSASTGTRRLDTNSKHIFFTSLDIAPERRVRSSTTNGSNAAFANLSSACGMHSCFDIYRCGKFGENKLSVFVYPIKKIFIDGKQLQSSFSREFYEIIEAIVESPYYTSDPSQACIFVPTIDLLNIQPFVLPLSPDSLNMTAVSHALQSLEFWGEDGSNHLLFNMFPRSDELLALSKKAIVAASAFSAHTYRQGFHIPIISFHSETHSTSNHLHSSQNFKFARNRRSQQNVDSVHSKDVPETSKLNRLRNCLSNLSIDISKLNTEYRSSNYCFCHFFFLTKKGRNISKGHFVTLDRFNKTDKKPLCVSAQGFLPSNFSSNDVLILSFCKHDPFNYSIRCKGDIIYKYPDIIMVAEYCLLVGNVSHLILWDILSVGCVPVIVPHHQRLPFDEYIDWRRNAIVLYDHQLPEIGSILRQVSNERYQKLKSQIRFTFNSYFKTMRQLTRTVLEVIKERVFPHTGRTICEWNHDSGNALQLSPIFNPVIAPKAPGFTAVILAYDRVPSLFQVVERVALVPSLSKILVIWNNQKNKPPSADLWPKTSKPLRVIQTTKNQMSNRFYPYDEIETEAVFSLDDDIIMLTVDEIEFGFEAWREFSDRIVGFPSRNHVWDNSTGKWKYESEWKNEISMVLTGAAFYHKYWHYSYTYEMPRAIRDSVDQRMNCEDIAMNFLIANTTGKAPIKVTPRKKFKCPTCSNNEMLSADSGHMMVRTDCINEFSKIYGYMPLVPVEFRADPVLFKVDNLPNKLKKFKDIGSL